MGHQIVETFYCDQPHCENSVELKLFGSSINMVGPIPAGWMAMTRGPVYDRLHPDRLICPRHEIHIHETHEKTIILHAKTEEQPE